MEEQLLETWAIHDRINRYLLDAVPAEALDSVSASRGRTVGKQFAHVHNVRLMWLKQVAPELLKGLDKVEKEQAMDGARLREALEASGAAVAALLRQSMSAGGKLKGFRPHVVGSSAT